MVPPPPPPLPLLLLLLLTGAAARPALPRAMRHSDGTFTSELSRLRDSARLQRLLQGLVGKRSDQEAENGTACPQPAEGELCLPLSQVPVRQTWTLLRPLLEAAWAPGQPSGPRPGVKASEWTEARIQFR
ncbi:secretin [Perognathus longimembris pacificus]|uniref:secretin n=1 Tax=Perognathus longimembris pacificus TaxID=214514 RepID=UPI002018F88F|nr:secretin [Perognathus longimembris pacificus]